jgi:hypothetical protein
VRSVLLLDARDDALQLGVREKATSGEAENDLLIVLAGDLPAVKSQDVV